MKKILKTIIIYIITLEAKLILKIYKPKIIAITGSVGKTSTKDAIFSALSESFHIRKNQKSFNSEIGVPLTILGLDNGYDSFLKWLSNIIEGLFVIFSKDYPDWLVLEFGVDQPNDMKNLVKWIKIDIAVITRFPDVPVHVENFESPKQVIAEKKQIINAVKETGYVILNGDDAEVLNVKNDSKRKVMTFGIENENVDILSTNEEVIYDEHELPKGINFKVDYLKSSIPVRLNGVLGRQHVYPVLAAIACGVSQGIRIIEMSKGILDHKSAPGRMNLLNGINNSIIIDDSYNASPVAVQEAVKVLGEIKSKNKIAVLGDMSEIGKYTANEHKIVGKMIADKKVNMLFTLGKKSEFIAEEAIKSGMDKDKVFQHSECGELTKELKEYINDGSVILVKGSQVSRMERIVEQIILNKEDSKKLLVRQDDFWKER